jgi:hypothetical protein
LIRKPQGKLAWYAPIKEPVTVTMAEEGAQMDVKYVYEQGLRKFQFSVFDPVTKKYYFEVFSTKEGAMRLWLFRKRKNIFDLEYYQYSIIG